MTNVATRPEAGTAQAPPKLTRQFVNFPVYKVDAAWRGLSKKERHLGKAELAEVIKSFDGKRCQILTFSTMGMRADGDFLLWVISADLETIQELATAINKTSMGQYLTRTHSFLSMTKRSMYLDRINPEHPEDRAHLVPGKYKYFFVYPFVKKREWYLLSMEDRQKLMDEHIRMGNKYPSVKLNTTYSFGLDDQEFVVAFETDSPADFLDLVQELRESQGSLYTLRDTPIITCLRKNVHEVLDDLG
jgi:chlorite dismutase